MRKFVLSCVVSALLGCARERSTTVGYSCLPPLEVQETAAEELRFCNSIRFVFCDAKPPLVTMPAEPGGTCR